MEISQGNTMENSGKQNPKMGFKPPRAEMTTFKWLSLKNLRSRTLGTDSESRPPPPDVPIRIQDHSRRRSSHSAILLSTFGSKRWISMVMADDENSDFVANAAEQKVIREPPEIRFRISRSRIERIVACLRPWSRNNEARRKIPLRAL